ncbi:FHA domain protein [Aspergillus oryzae 100-8]|uniref:Forkhead-associated protein n=4 Tax=Aspergillus subgen. Circumdati TaxID=2720871 RepID=A0A1S9DDH5_ASPOZ|nr:FHA domain protein [Aspergillus oryzae 3.042]KDE75990.1 FHA domain protein [Aspergillus oryzae 100-8]OOO06976.1 Forkhead-associated protein [Aspergillus oryzae]RAQ51046.1 cytoplasm to vacuole targeting Vps64 [Aspergillus flavus]|eukprot:EIT74315.1 FHA domain protein [Aspergillus oryzae 3.042]
MTAVASPPSVQSGPRLGWYESGNGGQGALSSMNGDEVSRMFMPRKTIQRSNSSSSLGSTTSTSTVTSTPQNTNAGQSHIPESATWSSKKKPSRSLWPNSKSEPVSGVSNARSQAMPAFSSGPTASSAMSAIHHQPSSIVPSQHMLQPQQNGVRAGSAPSGEPPAVLTLVPLNGTFEKKQINVPYFPEVVRIGRQTNAKTVPTPANGFFDSKVLSRQHAEVWAEKGGRIFIRDVKSSNGTFVNGTRLSPENRESEPHELRENDQLELGIDIISEDQTTVVHHKVCCKVEYAGVYGTMPNILDLTLGDLDPASGGGLLPSPLSQPLSHMRGRSGSSLSNRSVQSTASSQFNALQQQRQMNYWNSPISIEQVVKRLTSEMKQAKQQSQDLRQTDEFLTNLTKSGHPEKERVKSSPADSTSSRQVNGRPKMPRLDSFSRFSDPPAPPPQQPLPEKPDALPRNGTDATSPLKRSDTEKPKIGAISSPVSRESSQILSLIEALSSAKRELDSQGARVKELESLLLEERTARQSAEEKARSLELRAKDNDFIANHTTSDSHTINNQETSAEQLSPEETLVNGVSPEPSLNDSIPEEKSAATNNNDLQQRLEAMMEEMEEMRKQITVFRDRAEKAESETVETRKSLAEMIETLRREREERSEANESTVQTQDATDHSSPSSADEAKNHPVADSETEPECTGTSPLSKEAEISDTTFATQPRKHDILQHSSPYASMLGVVLLGVGLMAYLNGWQKMDK